MLAYWQVLHTDLARGRDSSGRVRLEREDLPFVLSHGASFRDLVTADLFLKGSYSGRPSGRDVGKHKDAMLAAHKREMLKAGSTKAGVDWFFNGATT